MNSSSCNRISVFTEPKNEMPIALPVGEIME